MPPASTEPAEAPATFDALAAGYDESFTHSFVGRHARARVWTQLDAAFPFGARVLEFGCGTGEDACHLAARGVHVYATDTSPGMVAATAHKAAQRRYTTQVHVAQLDMDTLEGPATLAARFPGLSCPLDGAYADFGALNCVQDLPRFAAALAACLRPGARVLWNVMGPHCPWEWLWFLARLRPRDAFRRLRPGGTPWRGLRIHYPGPRACAAAFAPYFAPCGLIAVNTFLPPSYAEAGLARIPGLLPLLARADAATHRHRAAAAMADHYLITLERRPD